MKNQILFDDIAKELKQFNIYPDFDILWFDLNFKSAKTKIKLLTNEGYKLYTDLEHLRAINYRYLLSILRQGKENAIYNINIWTKVNNCKYKLLPNQTYINANDNNLKWICPKCNNVFKSCFNNIKNGQNCGVCSISYQIVQGFNDLYSTHNHLVKYIVDIEYSKTISAYSHKKIQCVCPDCGYEKNIKCSKLVISGFSCSCNDKISIPTKFMHAILRQLNIKFEKEYKFKDAKYVYDFFIKDMNMTIEVHGGQHYEESSRGRTLEYEINNDINKRLFSESKGLIHIEIDARHSNFNFLKNSFAVSLNKYFFIDNINWNNVFEYSMTNLIKTACDLRKNNNLDITEISKLLNLCTMTICKYLKIGNDIGWCVYNSDDERKRGSKKLCKGVKCYTMNGCFINEYNSIIEASKITKINKVSIGCACRKKYKHAGGYMWEFI